MKITIVQGAFFPVPPLMGGAVEKIWFELGRAFARRGHKVTHISRTYPALPDNECIDGVQHVRVRGSDTPHSMVRLKWRDLMYSIRVLGALPPSDILVTNTFWLPMLASGSRHGKIYVHVARYPKGQMRFYGRAARLQTVSNHIGKAIRVQTPSMADRVTVIPNFITNIVDSRILTCRKKQILYVGRVHPEKGLHLLIDAFTRLISRGFDEWQLCIVGPWELKQGGGGIEYHQRLIAQSGEGSRFINWVGPVFSEDQLNDYYRESSLFVYPSLAGKGEAFPLAPLEAMSQGCPPVVSSLECFADFIKPGHNGWMFDHQSIDPALELKRTLALAMDNEIEIRSASGNAIHTAEHYSLSAVTEQYLADFERVTRCA
jgi:glycosyltransferase involved in cell wall biosynthesis